MDINDYLKQIAVSKAPDLHVKVGRVPIVRMPTGDLYEMQNGEAVSEQTMQQVLQQVLSPEDLERFQANQEVDAAYSVLGAGRFRLNAYREMDGPALAFRSIPEKVPTLDEMTLPAVVREFTQKTKGLMVVTGPTGSGKSTTLAAMINEINMKRRCHIITIEDPVEFIHPSQQSLVTQREVGEHTGSFPNAIRAAMRQDPDVILIGEMRDLETVSAAITLAETGHLVFATLHTQDASQTVDRIIDVFPADQQDQIRMQLSTTLLGVMAQRLIPRADGQGRALAMEVLVRNDAVSNCIKEGSTHQLYSMMQIGREDGMQTLDTALADLYSKGIISEEEMLKRARDPQMINNLSQNA